MVSGYDWADHSVELRRWVERQHPRDSKGKFTHGQRVRVPYGTGHYPGVVTHAEPDTAGYVGVDVHKGRAGSVKANVLESALVPAENRSAAVARRRRKMAGKVAVRGAAAGVGAVAAGGALGWAGYQLGKDDRAARALNAAGRRIGRNLD